jgi:hypothetical protein
MKGDVVKNKPCVECTVFVRLISWNPSRGSETVVNDADYDDEVRISASKKNRATATLSAEEFFPRTQYLLHSVHISR